MHEIARRAGVTRAVVSLVLHGRPGVPDAVRRRVLAVADELGRPPAGPAWAFGLVIGRPAHTLGLEPFFMRLMAGIQGELAADTTPLLLTVAADVEAEIAVYRDWWARRAVDGVFVVDLRVDDARVPVLEDLGLPAVVVGAPLGAGSLPAVWSDEAAGVASVAAHLAELGHRRIARVTGPARLRHTEMRTAAFHRAAARLGLRVRTVEADYTTGGGTAATRAALADGGGDGRPTAVVYDNDVMAVAGLAAARGLGLRVPADVSLVAWDDSALCRLVDPALTALSRDVHAYGALAARRLREAVADGVSVSEVREAAATLTVRASTAVAPVR
ncbi:LacI family DNA-binding transcriptional regulator [Streptomyces sp. RFCAC02]|uniref:LacI family DNA-binding transcriptional regulator n=1 Tax=Streptomyces sp. RFCAC02 TaxID=2499143 RepID=UPI001F102259|nr:LacI family DNA-binding transcriptional regulator [Streptomyces sp. RFCAC02]